MGAKWCSGGGITEAIPNRVHACVASEARACLLVGRVGREARSVADGGAVDAPAGQAPAAREISDHSTVGQSVGLSVRQSVCRSVGRLVSRGLQVCFHQQFERTTHETGHCF